MSGYSLFTRDQVEVVPFNALQPVNISIGTTVRAVAEKQVTWMGYVFHNNTASDNWVQVFFRPAGQVVLGTTPPDFTVLINANDSATLWFKDPIRQGTGFSVAGTTTETGSSAPATLTTGQVLIKRSL